MIIEQTMQQIATLRAANLTAEAEALETKLNAFIASQSANVSADKSVLGSNVTVRANNNKLRGAVVGKPVTGYLVDCYERISRAGFPYLAAKVKFKATFGNVSKEVIMTAPISAENEGEVTLTENMNVRVTVYENTYNGVTRNQPEYVIE